MLYRHQGCQLTSQARACPESGAGGFQGGGNYGGAGGFGGFAGNKSCYVSRLRFDNSEIERDETSDVNLRPAVV